MCDLNVCNLGPVKRNVCMALHFSNERMVNDGNIFNDATIAQVTATIRYSMPVSGCASRNLLQCSGNLLLGRIRTDLTMLHLGTCEGIEDFTGMTTDPTIS